MLKKLGEGSYGIVYQLDEKHALKRNLVHRNCDFIGNIREASYLQQLKHPHILKLKKIITNPSNGWDDIDSSVPGDRNKDDMIHFIVEKATCDLHDYIHNNDFKEQEVCSIIVGILLGLHAMHERQIMHRDLKPSNILIFKEGNTVTSKICDFGMCKNMSQVGFITPNMFTGWYRAPEIMTITQGKSYDEKSDIWAVGCIIMEILQKKTLLHKIREDNNSKFKQELKRIGISNSSINPMEWKLSFTSKRKSQIRNLNEWIDFCSLFLKVDPKKRISALQALNHPLLRDYIMYSQRIIQEYTVEKTSKKPMIKPWAERFWAGTIVTKIYESRAEHSSWYRERILFHSLDLFDRYLNALDEFYPNEKLYKKFIPKGLEKSTNQRVGKHFDQTQSYLIFLTIVYLYTKYFDVYMSPTKFRDIYEHFFQEEDPNHFTFCKNTEFIVLNLFDFNIYQNNVYEEIKSAATRGFIRDLLYVYSFMNDSGELTFKEIYDLFEETRREYIAVDIN